VAGFVADTPHGDTLSNSMSSTVLDRVDPSVEGGGKIWMRVQRASVDSKGHITVALMDSTPEGRLVAQELIGEAVCLGTQRAAEERQKPPSATDIRRQYRARDTPTMSSARGYGFGSKE
jgi:hypothetical protein